jgi:AcrR family transcriptional regulator
MPREANRSGDRLKLLDLMWAPSTRVGRSGTTVAAITDAAIELADRTGLDALTMRAVADRVGVGVMTLYGYLPGKPELVEVMLDRIAAATYGGRPLPAEQPHWRAGLRYVALRNYEHALDHGWSVEVPSARPILGPGVCRKYEAELAPLDGIGLSDRDMDHVLTTVLNLAGSAARWQVGLDRVRAESRLTDEQWWRLSEPVLSTAMAGAELPISGRVGGSVASAGDPRGSLETGLDILLDGLERRVSA